MALKHLSNEVGKFKNKKQIGGRKQSEGSFLQKAKFHPKRLQENVIN